MQILTSLRGDSGVAARELPIVQAGIEEVQRIGSATSSEVVVNPHDGSQSFLCTVNTQRLEGKHEFF